MNDVSPSEIGAWLTAIVALAIAIRTQASTSARTIAQLRKWIDELRTKVAACEARERQKDARIGALEMLAQEQGEELIEQGEQIERLLVELGIAGRARKASEHTPVRPLPAPERPPHSDIVRPFRKKEKT